MGQKTDAPLFCAAVDSAMAATYEPRAAISLIFVRRLRWRVPMSASKIIFAFTNLTV